MFSTRPSSKEQSVTITQSSSESVFGHSGFFSCNNKKVPGYSNIFPHYGTYFFILKFRNPKFETCFSQSAKGYRYQLVLVFSNKIKIHENLYKKTVTSTGSVVDPNNLNIWIRIQGYVFNLEKIVMKI